MKRSGSSLCSAVVAAGFLSLAPAIFAQVSLRDAVIVIRPGTLPAAEQSAAAVLQQELEKRSGFHLALQSTWPQQKTVIAITSTADVPMWTHHSGPFEAGSAAGHPEGYRLRVQTGKTEPAIVWIMGADARGALYGVGDLLRSLDWALGKAELPETLDHASAPKYAIRGHQLGYRPQANSYDTWTPAQYDQYIRELTFFGVNSIEGIPFPESKPTPWMKTPQREMNRAIGEICQRYGLDYWVWVPATIDLRDAAKRRQFMAQIDEFLHDTPTLTAVFVPSGDPGKNAPELLLPFLADIARLLKTTHPEAKVWLSIQEQKPAYTETYMSFAAKTKPAWFGGLVVGPSGAPLAETRRRLPAEYKLRLYPDVTHNKLSQFEVPFWDQALALTLGRQTINPRPVEYAEYHRQSAPFADGTITYSDGAHDDVNKIIWSALDWNPSQNVSDILEQYARVYFEPLVAHDAADAILALETDWHGPLLSHGAVDVSRREWERLAAAAPELNGNWRWQMCLLRAEYDSYIRARLKQDTLLQRKAEDVLAESPVLGSAKAMAGAKAELAKAQSEPVAAATRALIVALCEQLYQSVGLQTSVAKYGATNNQRGPILDYLDLPLNNRWWLEDQFAKVATMPGESQRVDRLLQLARWERPGEGGFYDAVGNLNKSPHVLRFGEIAATPGMYTVSEPTYWWMENGFSRARLAEQATMWPAALVYDGLDPNATYTLRVSGVGKAIPRANGELLPAAVRRTSGDDHFLEFAVPQRDLLERKLTITWDHVPGEDDVSWHDRSRLSEVWLLRAPTP